MTLFVQISSQKYWTYFCEINTGNNFNLQLETGSLTLFPFSQGTQDGQCGACLLHAVDHNKMQI